MNIKQITVLVIVATIIVLIGYDIYALIAGGSGATISWTVWTSAQHYPVIPFAVGVLCGHFFWAQRPPEESK